MKVKEIMHGVLRLPSHITVADAAAVMDEKLSGSALLEENGSVVGIITERDILKKVVAKKLDPTIVKASEIMSSLLITIDVNEAVIEASRMMDQHRIRRLIVTENREIVGKVTANCISRNVKYITAGRLVESVRF